MEVLDGITYKQIGSSEVKGLPKLCRFNCCALFTKQIILWEMGPGTSKAVLQGEILFPLKFIAKCWQAREDWRKQKGEKYCSVEIVLQGKEFYFRRLDLGKEVCLCRRIAGKEEIKKSLHL